MPGKKFQTNTRRMQGIQKEPIHEVQSSILRRQNCNTQVPQTDCDYVATQMTPCDQ